MTIQHESFVLSLIKALVPEIARISKFYLRGTAAIINLVGDLEKLCEQYFLTLDDNDESEIDSAAKYDALEAIQVYLNSLCDVAYSSEDIEVIQCALSFLGSVDVDEAGFLTIAALNQ